MTKLEIKMNDGTTMIVDAATYNVNELTEKLNDNTINMVAIGDIIIQRYAITRIMPIIEETV